ncbi:MAG: hypothetical protein AMDU1_APLC00047G0015 [Thermoplasmatales archaeon A-plasma]|jgi:hypothetical protein|nr:MAG: hypothetical protein AMDU1_APLC00047G0015 [Thermoplasmatales archaeon A-plasma]
MKDSMGRGYWDRRREKSFEKLHKTEEERREELRKAFQDKSGENIARLSKFVSFRSLMRAMIPQLIIGVILGYVEYDLVGPIYTIISVIVYVPMIYLYSRTLRTRNGVFLMVPSSDFLDWERLFISEEIWSLVEKKTGLTLESGRINGRITYWCVDVKYLEGSGIPYWVEIAWAHYNRVKFAMFEPVIDDLTRMLTDALLAIGQLRKMGRVMSLNEGTRQTDENIDAITSGYRDKIMTVLKKQKISDEEAQAYESEVNDLLQNPEYLRALIKKRNEGDAA